MSTSALPQLTYDGLSVGQMFSETTMAVSRDMIANYGKAVHNRPLEAQATAPPERRYAIPRWSSCSASPAAP